MSQLEVVRIVRSFRFLGAVASVALFIALGCGNQPGAGGCVLNGNANGNSGGDNDNDAVDNDNGGGTDNDNVIDNDNAPGNENDNTASNENENENDNLDGGGNSNGNTTTGGNDNVAPGNDNASNNDNGDVGNTNDNAASNDNVSANSNVNANGNVNANDNSGIPPTGNTNSNTSPPQVPTKTSGAAQPGDDVSLTFAEGVPAQCFTSTQWTQSASDTVQVALTSDGAGGVTFEAPNVTASTILHFTVNAPNCPASVGTSGSAEVSVEVASATLTLPVTIGLNEPLDLDHPTITDVEGEPAGASLLYGFSAPANVVADIDPGTHILTVSEGNDGQIVTIRLQVLSLAGPLLILAEVTDTITIQVP